MTVKYETSFFQKQIDQIEKIEKYIQRVEKDQNYDFWDRTPTGYYKMKDPETFWKDFSGVLQKNNFKLDTILQYKAQKSSGLTFDCDIFIPCDNSKQPIDLKRDWSYVIKLAKQYQRMLDKYLQDAQTYQPLTEEDLQYVILERANLDLNRTEKDQDENLYVRYGFHIYFMNIKLDGSEKDILKNLLLKDQQFKYFFENEILPVYKTTNFYKYFDTQPFTGSTSLPLTFPETNKQYNKFVYGTPDKPVSKKVREYPAILECLDPFNGKPAIVSSVYLTDLKAMTLEQLVRKERPKDYLEALAKVYQVLKQEVQRQTTSQQIIGIVAQFNHVMWKYQEQLILLLYEYFHENAYITQLAYFIAMAGEDEIPMSQVIPDLPDILDRMSSRSDIFWINSTKDRYPIKAQKKVQSVIAKYKHTETQDIIKKIIAVYNKNQTELKKDGRIQEEVIMKQTSGIYDEFTTWASCQEHGLFSKYPIEEFDDYIKDFFMEYLNLKLKSRLRIYKPIGYNPVLYEFNDSIETKDLYHYKAIQKEDYIGIIKSYIKNFTSDYTYLLMNHQMPAKPEDSEEPQEEGKDDVPDHENAIKFVKKLKRFCNNIKQQDFDNTVADLRNSSKTQPDSEDLHFGVYNGVLEYDEVQNKFKFLQGREAREYFITQSTLFKVEPYMLDENNYLKSIEDIAEIGSDKALQLANAYREIDQTFKEIYTDDIDIFYWKIASIIIRMLYKSTPCYGIFILECSGSGGKTFQQEVLQTWLGTKQKQISNGVEIRQIEKGYCGVPSSALIQTSKSNSSQHDSGGAIELKGAALANLTELDMNYPIVNAQVKSLAENTTMSIRKAYQGDSEPFVNHAFIELQTNNPLRFNQALDYGTARRLFRLVLNKKFVSLSDYNQYKQEFEQRALENPKKKDLIMKDFHRNYGIAKKDLSDKMCKNFFYVDAGNLYLLEVFMKFVDIRKHNEDTKWKEYIPQKLLDSQKQLLQTYHKWINPFIEQLNTQARGKCLLYSTLEDKLQEYLYDMSLAKKTKDNKYFEEYVYLLKQKLINRFYAVDKLTDEEQQININKFSDFDGMSDKFVIIVKDCQFRDKKAQKYADLEWKQECERIREYKKMIKRKQNEKSENSEEYEEYEEELTSDAEECEEFEETDERQ